MLNFDDITDLRKKIKDNFNQKLHLHDTCGGQYFTLDTINDEIKDFIAKYLNEKNLKYEFSKDNLSFYIIKGNYPFTHDKE